ncbi:MAG: LD-carboxypeptidase [Candidatus Marsarchaeota archaeon]|jgi:muramoyltetrapeptide carboxypeptidase|nr:LD-carboxypeptidase [Candidatus Marsarchaeota archaeon]MCL5418500.1 LD-carboxypeptidase [Candidatus Marsarchaeota archaeon]
MHEMIKPRALKPGDTIKIIAPSSTLGNVEGLSNAIDFIKKHGFKVSLSTNLTHATPQRFSTTGDRIRKTELENAFKNDDIDAIIALRGGAGSIDLLDIIDYDIIREHPKVFVGYSDITLLQLAFLKKANLITFQGPMLIDLTEGDSQVLNQNWSTLLSIISAGDALELKNPIGSKWSKTITEGRGRGMLLGGNMTMLSLISNTQYMPSTEGSVMFLEDVDLAPWMVDNIFTSLIIKGAMNGITGLVFGEFPHYGFEEALKNSSAAAFLFNDLFVEDYVDSTIKDIIIDILIKKLQNIPSFVDFACCHGKYITTIPMGAMVEIDAKEQKLSMLESAVS